MTTFPMVANAWQRTASVDFRGTGISETIQVRPSTNPSNPAALADAHHAEAVLIRDGESLRGDRVVYRPWFNLAFGVEPWPYHSPNNTAADRDGPNAWPQVHGPFEPTTLPAHMTAWWDAYNARTIANGTFPDALVLDNEVRREFYYFATEAQRQAYFLPVTQPGFVVPGLAENPWVGQNIWTYGQPATDGFIQFWSQWAADDLTNGLERLHGGLWSAPQAASIAVAKAERFGAVPEGDEGGLDARPISNYRDAAYGFTWGEVFNRPGRLPYAQTRIGLISSPVCYFNRRNLPLFAAEPEYTTVRAIANRQRWKSVGFNLSEVRSCNASEPGDTHPWVQAPGWGWNGGEAWAPLVQLPFELIHWRVWMEHLVAKGISEVQLWNPIPPPPPAAGNDPHAATTHAFMAAWFTGRTVGPLVRDLPALDITARTYTTVGNTTVETHYADLFEMTEVRYRRAPGTLAVPYLVGWPWSETDPLLISAGPAGDAELAAMLAAVANNQGTPVVAREILTGMENPMPQQVITKAVRTFVTIPIEIMRGQFVTIGMDVEAVVGEFGTLAVEAQVRQVKGGNLLHDFSPANDPIEFVDGTGDMEGLKTFTRDADTLAWPEGLCRCDVFLWRNGKRFGLARYEWDVMGTYTDVSEVAA